MTTKIQFQIKLVVLSMFLCTYPTNAQKKDNASSNLEETILELDSKFWQAYNTCDLKNFKTFLTDDLEFYHDKGGLTSTSSKLMEQISNRLCGNKSIQLRREAIKESVHIYPLNNYGAIITGEHLFYQTENQQKERLVERGKFTHIWKKTNNKWQMSRVISYDHQPASENDFKEVIALDYNALKDFIGNYKAPKTGSVVIAFTDDNTLRMDAGQMKAVLYSETENIFFIKEAPISLEFVKDSAGKTVKFIVRENGNVVEEATKENMGKTDQSLSENVLMEEIALEKLIGTYKAPKTGLVTISFSGEKSIKMDAGPMKAVLHSEGKNIFSIKDAPITLEFIKNANGNIEKFIVRESGNVVEEAKRINE